MFKGWNWKRGLMFAGGGVLAAVATIIPGGVIFLPIIGKVAVTSMLWGAAGSLTAGALTPPGTKAVNCPPKAGN